MSRKPPIPVEERYALSPREAAELLGVDRSSFYRHIFPFVVSGAIQSLWIGSARRIVRTSLLAWAESRKG